MSLSSFIDGATTLPRELVGGAAVALGADQQHTQEFLGLDNNDDTDGIINTIKNDPAKFVGELVPYIFLPSKLFAKTLHQKTYNRAIKKGLTEAQAKRRKTAMDIGLTSATMGAYGAIESLAKASVDGTDSDAIKSGLMDATLTLGLATITHGAILGTRHIKSKIKQKKYIKDVFLDAGIPLDEAPKIWKMTEADKIASLKELEAQIQSNENMLRATIGNIHPTVKFKSNKKTSLFDKLFGAYSEDLSASEIPTLHQWEDSIIKPPSGIKGDVKDAVAETRAAGDNADAHLHQALRHSNALGISIKEAVPNVERRILITKALDSGNPNDWKALTDHEVLVAKAIRKHFDKYAKLLVKANVIKGVRSDYVPHILNIEESGNPLNDIMDSIGKRSHISSTTDRAKARVDDRELKDKNYKTLDIAELVSLYGQQVTRATTTKHVLDSIEFKHVKEKFDIGKGLPKASDNRTYIDHVSHPSVISHYIKNTYSKALKALWKADYKKAINVMHYSEINAKAYADKQYQISFDKFFKNTVLNVKNDYLPTLDMLFKTGDINSTVKAATMLNAVMKRLLIFGSLFHFNALAESALFAGAGGIGAVLAGAAGGYVISGLNPAGAVVGGSLGAGIKSMISTHHISDALRHGQYGDRYDFALRYVDVKPPRDVDNDAFFSSLEATQTFIDKHVPSNLAKGILKGGTKAIGGINKVIDVVMWDRLMSGSKLLVFERKMEELTLKNLDLPLNARASEHELGLMAGQFVNDAFGGQNWRKLAEGVDNAFGRRIAATMATPQGKVWTNLIMFAPDWTISNLRIIAKSFPLINKSKLSRQMYQRYAVRAAMYYMIMGTAIQMMLTGKPIWMNDDPTRIDLGDGRELTFSKQLSEPFKWLENPLHEATVKQSSIAKLIEEQLGNEKYVGALGNGHPIRSDSDTAIEKVGDSINIAGSHFAPIFVQDVSKNGMDGIYGFFGHPIYGSIRKSLKEGSGNVYTED